MDYTYLIGQKGRFVTELSFSVCTDSKHAVFLVFKFCRSTIQGEKRSLNRSEGLPALTLATVSAETHHLSDVLPAVLVKCSCA